MLPAGAIGAPVITIADAEQVYTSCWRVQTTAIPNVWQVKVGKLGTKELTWIDYPNARTGALYTEDGISFTIPVAGNRESFEFKTNGAKRNAIETGATVIPSAP